MNDPARVKLDLDTIEQPRALWARPLPLESRSNVARQGSARIRRTATLTIVGLALCALGVNEVVDWTLRHEIHDKQLAPPNALLAAIHAGESSRLSQYRWIRKSEGVLRIPVERAKRLVIQDYAQAQAATPPVPASSRGKP